MKKLMFIAGYLCLAAFGLIVDGQQPQPKNLTENSYEQARRILERGIETSGGLKNLSDN